MPLRLMCFTAHPDDECGAFAGALLEARQRGVESSVVCLTEGRAATHRGSAGTSDELAQLRRREFAAALRMLGVEHGEVLNYPDGKLAGQDFLAVTTALVERVRRFRPQIVLTFSADGNVNLHPDHTMVCVFATAAFHWAGRAQFAPQQIEAGLLPYRPQKLYYATASFLAYANADEARRIALAPASLHLQMAGLKEKKLEAFAQHATQADLLAKVRAFVDKTGDQESYLLAAAPGIRSSPLETDMFADLLEDGERD